MKKKTIAITLGDINGIGVEVVIKAMLDNPLMNKIIPVIIGSFTALKHYAVKFDNKHFLDNVRVLSQLENIKNFNSGEVLFVNIEECKEKINPSKVTQRAGKIAVLSLKKAMQLYQRGLIDGLVTAPINKKNVYSKDFPFTGHTDFFKHYFDEERTTMLMVSKNMRIGLLTEHLSLREVSSHITKNNIKQKIMTIASSLIKDFNVKDGEIAILGLNPHAGDDGVIGNEEAMIKDAILELRKTEKIKVDGPFSADSFFVRERHCKYNAVLAMYHDQGLIPFKILNQEEGVNFTAGLDLVRTSPDHGTAFDIAGKNVANENSMKQAIEMCLKVIENRTK